MNHHRRSFHLANGLLDLAARDPGNVPTRIFRFTVPGEQPKICAAWRTEYFAHPLRTDDAVLVRRTLHLVSANRGKRPVRIVETHRPLAASLFSLLNVSLYVPKREHRQMSAHRPGLLDGLVCSPVGKSP